MEFGKLDYELNEKTKKIRSKKKKSKKSSKNSKKQHLVDNGENFDDDRLFYYAFGN